MGYALGILFFFVLAYLSFETLGPIYGFIAFVLGYGLFLTVLKAFIRFVGEPDA